MKLYKLIFLIIISMLVSFPNVGKACCYKSKDCTGSCGSGTCKKLSTPPAVSNTFIGYGQEGWIQGVSRCGSCFLGIIPTGIPCGPPIASEACTG